MSGNLKFRRMAAMGLCGLASLATAVGYGQSTAWSPSRNATRPGSPVLTQSFESERPEWQRSPSGGVHPTSHNTFTPSSPSAVRTAHGRTSPAARPTTARGPNHQRIAYDVELAPGEQLVGQPTMSEEGQPVPKRPGPTSELLPTPDGISGGRTNRQGEIIHEGPHDDAIHVDPGFDYEHGNYEDVLHGDCESCVGGDCDSCTGGMYQRDEWADPTACLQCGAYGYHRLGCGRVAACLYNCLGPIVREWSIFAGAQGFKGPLDGGLNGNFGFNEGFNLAGPIIPWPRCGLGYQLGGRWAQSNLSGTQFGTAAREQAFVTAGFFHRAYRGCGFQWGVAYDWLSDNYTTDDTFAQMRTEFSFVGSRGHELGFLGMFGVKNTNTLATIEQADQYNIFYRHTTKYGGQGRVWVGMTSHNLGIFGTDFRVPLSNRCDLVGGFNYIIPNDGTNGGGGGGATQESWGLAMNLVWYVGRPKAGIHSTPFRPLFNVADNNVLMLEQP